MEYRMKIENSSYFMASQVKKKETVKIKQSMTRTTGNFRALTLRGKSAGRGCFRQDAAEKRIISAGYAFRGAREKAAVLWGERLVFLMGI